MSTSGSDEQGPESRERAVTDSQSSPSGPVPGALAVPEPPSGSPQISRRRRILARAGRPDPLGTLAAGLEPRPAGERAVRRPPSAPTGDQHAPGRGRRVVRRGTRAAGRGVHWTAAKLTEQVLTTAPRLPVRSQVTLRGQFPGQSPDQIAQALIDGAARMSAAAGAAAGTWAAVPFLPGYPAEVVAETLAVVGVEIKLIAELHEVYGLRVPGPVAHRMQGYVAAWAHRRGVTVAPGGVMFALGSPLRRRLQRRLAARLGQSAVSLGPLMTGAAAGALINRRETRRLGEQIRDDLRARSSLALGWPGPDGPGPA